MRYILLSILLYLSSQATAQLSVGAFAAADFWMHRQSYYQASRHNWSAAEGLFVRWDCRNRLSYELLLQHSSEFKAHSEYYGDVYDFPLASKVFVTNDFSTRVFGVGLKADYRLTKKRGSRVLHYVGLQLRPTLWQQSVSEEWYDSATHQPVLTLWNSRNNYFRFWAGAQYTVGYYIRPRVSLRAVVTYLIEPGLLFNSFATSGSYQDPYGKASLDFGIAYRLR